MCVGGKIRSHRGTASCRSSFFFFFFLRCAHPLSVWLIRGCASEILKNNTHNTFTHKPFIFFPILSLTFLNRSKNSHFLPPQLEEKKKKTTTKIALTSTTFPLSIISFICIKWIEIIKKEFWRTLANGSTHFSQILNKKRGNGQ